MSQRQETKTGATRDSWDRSHSWMMRSSKRRTYWHQMQVSFSFPKIVQRTPVSQRFSMCCFHQDFIETIVFAFFLPVLHATWGASSLKLLDLLMFFRCRAEVDRSCEWFLNNLRPCSWDCLEKFWKATADSTSVFWYWLPPRPINCELWNSHSLFAWRIKNGHGSSMFKLTVCFPKRCCNLPLLVVVMGPANSSFCTSPSLVVKCRYVQMEFTPSLKYPLPLLSPASEGFVFSVVSSF